MRERVTLTIFQSYQSYDLLYGLVEEWNVNKLFTLHPPPAGWIRGGGGVGSRSGEGGVGSRSGERWSRK